MQSYCSTVDYQLIVNRAQDLIYFNDGGDGVAIHWKTSTSFLIPEVNAAHAASPGKSVFLLSIFPRLGT